VRILLLEVPKLLRDILERAIRQRDGFELIRDARPALKALTEGGPAPDVVVLGLSAEDDAPLVPVVLSRWPLARVITISGGGKSVEIAHLAPCSRTLLQPTPEAIIEWFSETLANPSGRAELWPSHER
jgi:chemotaxis response regulator CheB